MKILKKITLIMLACALCSQPILAMSEKMLEKYKKQEQEKREAEARREAAKKREEEISKECAICLEGMKESDDLATLSCKHTFHKECIKDWLKRQTTCPVCRNPISQQDQDVINAVKKIEKGKQPARAGESSRMGEQRGQRQAAVEDIEARDQYGRTALQRAAIAGDFDLVKTLIARGANVNTRDNHQNTPLHDAAWYGHNFVIIALANAGADVNARNRHGLTPLGKAHANNKTREERILRDIYHAR